MDDIITSKAFISLRFEQAMKILDRITKTKSGWHTQEVERRASTYTIRVSSKQRSLDEIVTQEVAQLITRIEFLTKQFAIIRER